MSVKEIISIVALGLVVISGVVSILIAVARGDLKKFIVEKMEEAEELYKGIPKPEKSKKKLQYVLKQVDENYGFSKLFLNSKKFIEYIAQIINSKR